MCIMAGRRCTSEARENQENNKSTGETDRHRDCRSRSMRDGNSHSDLLASPEALALVQQAVSDSLLVVASCGADSDWAEDV
jgi:hypothetical protein